MLVLAFVVSYAILDGACRVRAAHQGPSRVAWLVGGSLAIGLSIWAMHFVALLSLRATLPMTEDPVTLGVAAVTAVVAAGGALYHVDRGAGGVPAMAVSGGLKGFALIATHYTMMAALHVPAVIRYDPLLILASVAVAVAVSIATLTFAERLQAERPARAALERVVIAAVMAGGLWVMHELASRSGRFVPLPGQQDELRAAAGHPHALAQAWLGQWITAAAIAGVLALALAAAVSRWHAHRNGNRPAGDRLTGLPNGALVRHRLTGALTHEAPCAVIALRLENFETLRQGLGRRAAERLIVRLGWRLAGAVRPEDFVGRLSSSLYAVLVDDIEAVGSVAERVRERLGAPVASDGLLVLVPVSVGIAVARAGDSACDLLARAEEAAAREPHRAPLAAVAAPSMAA